VKRNGFEARKKTTEGRRKVEITRGSNNTLRRLRKEEKKKQLCEDDKMGTRWGRKPVGRTQHARNREKDKKGIIITSTNIWGKFPEKTATMRQKKREENGGHATRGPP